MSGSIITAVFLAFLCCPLAHNHEQESCHSSSPHAHIQGRKRGMRMVLTTSGEQKFSRSSPDGFLLHLFSQAPLDILGSGYNVAIENTEGVLARKRWKLDSAGSDSVFHR